MSIGKLDGGTTESHGETRRQRLHLQLRSGKTHNGKRVGAHGTPHHLINGGDFGFLEGIPENRRGDVDRTLSHKTHVCSTVCSQARTAQLMRLAQELDCHLCAPKQVLSSCVTHVSSMVVLSRAFFHEHFLFFTYLSYHTTRTLNTIPHISKLPRLTSCAIKNHSGVKTCRVAETRARQLPLVVSPRSLRPCQESMHILEIHLKCMM